MFENIENFKTKVINNIKRGFIKYEDVLFANLLLQEIVKLKKDNNISTLIKTLFNEYKSIKSTDFHLQEKKFQITLQLFVLEVLNGLMNSAKKNFVKRLVDISANHFVSTNQEAERFFNLIKKVYSLEEVIEILISEVFKGSFWNKDLITKKSNFLWVFPNFWICFGYEVIFKKLYNIWLEIFYKAMRKNDVEFVFFLMLPLTHIGIATFF